MRCPRAWGVCLLAEDHPPICFKLKVSSLTVEFQRRPSCLEYLFTEAFIHSTSINDTVMRNPVLFCV